MQHSQESEEPKGTTPERGKRPPKMEIIRQLAAVMNGVGLTWPAFPSKFRVLRDKFGEHRYLEEFDEKVLRGVSPQRIIDQITKYVSLLNKPGTALSPTDVSLAHKHWASFTPSFKETIYSVLEKSKPGYTYHRLEFDFINTNSLAEAPLFAEMMARTTNAEALCAFIGSLFIEGSNKQQYAWIYGEGNNGKSSLVRLLKKVMADSARSEAPPGRDDKFWTAGLLDKRLVYFPDCNYGGFITTDLFKRLTGDDDIRIEEKNKPSYSASLSAKYLFLGNEKPVFESKAADLRRVIFCKIDPIEGDPDPAYESRLWEEAPVVFGYCLNKYHELCPRNGVIPTDLGEVGEIAEGTEEDMDYVVQRELRVTFEPGTTVFEKSISTIDMNCIMEDYGITNVLQRKRFKSFFSKKVRD